VLISLSLSFSGGQRCSPPPPAADPPIEYTTPPRAATVHAVCVLPLYRAASAGDIALLGLALGGPRDRCGGGTCVWRP
jgi:hypothetical protein